MYSNELSIRPEADNIAERRADLRCQPTVQAWKHAQTNKLGYLLVRGFINALSNCSNTVQTNVVSIAHDCRRSRECSLLLSPLIRLIIFLTSKKHAVLLGFQRFNGNNAWAYDMYKETCLLQSFALASWWKRFKRVACKARMCWFKRLICNVWLSPANPATAIQMPATVIASLTYNHNYMYSSGREPHVFLVVIAHSLDNVNCVGFKAYLWLTLWP